MKPPAVISIHRQLCLSARCTAVVDYTDPCGFCPNGHFGRYTRKGCIGLGDIVASVATPIARFLHLPCIDPATKEPRPESGCAKRKQKLNEFGNLPKINR